MIYTLRKLELCHLGQDPPSSATDATLPVQFVVKIAGVWIRDLNVQSILSHQSFIPLASTIRGGGGCVTFAQSSSITVTNSIFTNATLLYSNAGELARISGYRGACHYDEIDAAIGIPSVVIYQNTTLDSCVITGIAQLATGVNASSFVVGSGSGGGFFSANGNLTISNVTVRNSIADTGGAVASLQAVFINITNSMFVSNSAYQFGGATSFWICKNVFMNNVIFANNSDNGEGTAVFVGDDSTTQVSLRNLAFSNPVYHQNTSCAILEAGYTLPGYFNLSDISFSSCPANVSNSNSILASALIGTLDPIQVSNLICN